MASATFTHDLAIRSRRRAFFLPREHGAWGMLLVPLAVGAAAGNPPWDKLVWILLFAVAALSLFCLRTPVEAALGLSPIRPQNDGERRLVHFFIFYYASAALLALFALIYWRHAYALFLLGLVAGFAFLIQAILKRLGRSTRLNSQLAGSIALSSTAAGAYYPSTGSFGPPAMLIWFANWLFAANQIHFVQLRLHTARAGTFQEKFKVGKYFLAHQFVSFLGLAMLWRIGWLPGLVLAAFVPVYARGFGWFIAPPRPLQVRRLGFSELLYAVVFGLIFIVGIQRQLSQ
jgi:hypothetical protein